AFVAALFGDRVQSVFLIGGRLLAAVDVLVQPGDALLIGQSVRAAAIDYRLLPVALIDAEGRMRDQPLDARLGPGAGLVAIAGLTELEPLLSRQPAPRDHAVDVTAFPPEARATLLELLGTERGLNPAEAVKALDSLPVCVTEKATRGRAEELAALLGVN